jgi:hypothetical protein
MFINWIIRLTLVLAIYGNAVQAHKHAYSWLGWLYITGFSICLVGFGEAVIWREEHQRMPHKWECPRCRPKTGMQSSDPRMVETFRHEHNRRVHLQEP